MDFIKSQFDKLILLVVFLAVVGSYLFKGGGFFEGIINNVLGALLMALTGGGAAALVAKLTHPEEPK